MALKPPQKQSLLQKALRDKKVLTQEVFMYQRLMEVMRDENSFEDILKLLITSVTKGLGYDRAGIFLADWERRVGQRMIGIDRYGKFEGQCEDLPLSPVKGTHWFSDMVYGHTKASFTNNLRRRVKKQDWEKNIDPGVLSNAITPITVGNKKIIGVLAVDNLFTQRRLKKSDLLSLTNFATQAGLAIESFRLHEKIRDLTIKDGLTGVYNRRYFDNYLPREVLRCRRYKRFLSLLYIDLDHFKDINDLHGHPAGDLVLKHVADRLVQGLRNVDIVARLGGDEFAVILPEVGPDGAKTVAERLFRSITENPAPLEILGIPGQKIDVSMGVSCFSDSMADYKELVKLADESLYQAKSAGRNRVGGLAAGRLHGVPYE
jgi:diguanylate cyclase (GGDEF)-like protein